MLNQWLHSALKQSATSQAALSRQLTEVLGRSIDRAAVNKMVKGTRSIAADELIEIENILGVPAPNKSTTRTVSIRGAVEAGAWNDAWEWDESSWYDVIIPADSFYAHFELFGVEVRGNSMNRRYEPGSSIVYTDIVETGEELIIGKRYIVERERPGGEREATVKKLWQDDAENYWLLPESDDPRHQEPIGLNDVENETIRIVGRVCYAVSRE